MGNSGQAKPTIRFGVFEVNPRSGEVRKSGTRIRLQDQPFKVLLALLEHPGEVVSREELRQRIWPTESFGDFDHAVNVAVAKLRTALGDSADAPRYVETLQRRGYRLIAPVASAPTSPAVDERSLNRPPDAGAELGFAAVRASAWEAPRRQSARIMLMVLPFDNLSGDHEQEYFSDGLTEELIAQLGRVGPRQLAVIARPSAMHYKSTTKRIDQIGRELGVDYILAGSVRRVGERVRVTAQLAQVHDQTQVWTESYDRILSDILGLQSDVAMAIAREIKVALPPREQARFSAHRQIDPEAYEAYLKGRDYWNRRTGEALTKAAEYFRQAIEKSPRFALAYSGLADSYILLGDTGYGILPPREALRQAEAAASRALEIDDTLAEAHTSLASVKEQFDWDWNGSERGFKKAIELQPGYAIAHHWYAYLLAQTGRLDEAHTEIALAKELDPLSLIINTDLGWIYYLARRYDQGIEQLLETLELEPGFTRAHYLLGRSYLEKQKYQEAVLELQRASDLSGNNAVELAGLACAYAASERIDAAAQILDELKERSRPEYVPPFDIALIYSALGQKDNAFAWIEKAFEEGSDFKDELGAGPALDFLRPDPRFQNLLRRMNFPR